MNKPLDFQQDTADRIYDLFTREENPRQRVLLADEVGLGKTTVASEVVSLMRKYPPFQEDEFYRVVYVCSNINIARQNIDQFGIKDVLSPDESRLSMQHLILAEKEKDIRKSFNKTEEMPVPEVIIPLTPFTSFNFASSNGSAQERALICAYLLRLGGQFQQKRDLVSDFMKTHLVTKQENWDYQVSRFSVKIDDAISAEDRDWMLDAIREKDREYTVLDSVLEMISRPKSEWKYALIISRLRKMFADISLDRLSPDLVIMDEFQRFRSLIADTDDEQSLIARKFFGKKDVKILLLSATPYKPFTTLDELNESGVDEHFSDFKQVVHFLSGSDSEEEMRFSEVWNRYNIALKEMSLGNLSVLDAVKADAEDSLYSMMCRTERFNAGNVVTREITVRTSDDDIKEYFQARRVLDSVCEKTQSSDFRSIPMDYVKSCPYVFSFMDGYKLKDFIAPWERSRARKTNVGSLYLQFKSVNNYREIASGNARLDWLRDSLFTVEGRRADGLQEGCGKFSSEKLLWVPASHPYYTTDGVYSENKGFSKVLVFSSWEMVPRMLSVMLTYTAEQKVFAGLSKKQVRIRKYYSKNNERYARGRLAKLEDYDNPLLYPCRYLADLYDPQREGFFGADVRTIRSEIESVISERLKGLSEEYGIPMEEAPRGEVRGAALIRAWMEMLDGIDRSEDIECLPGNMSGILADAAIGSPAVCSRRSLPEEKYEYFHAELGMYFYRLFIRPEGASVLDLCFSSKSECYVDAMFDYCVEGNLQAVLDEYLLIMGADKYTKFFAEAPSDAVPINVGMQDEDGTIIKKNMRMSYAVQFANVKMADKSVTRVANIRTAFNSPFRPFVLATTSVGQEGLDFHQYSRKLLHWNLPSNPVDMEQREGRVNRFRNLSIRQRLAQRYSDVFSWKDIFENAARDYKGSYSDIVPSWSLPPEFGDSDDLKVERIVLHYPLSIDSQRYKRLEEVLSLYRLTLGQPRQEMLLDILSDMELTDEQIRNLTIDLCPFNKSNI